jgi:hypothetical protein
MELSRVLVRLGAVASVVGLFLVFTYLGTLGLLLFFWGTIVVSVSWGLPQVEAHPVRVGTVGAALLLLGISWTTWVVFLDVGGCPGVTDCLPLGDLILDPFLLSGLAVAVIGIMLVSLSIFRWRRARSPVATGTPPATAFH